MIIWSGYGFLVFIIVFVDSLIANLIADKIANEPGYYDRHLIPLGLSFLFSSLVIFYLAKYFARKAKEGKGTRVFDKVTIAAGDKNRLFFIPFRYWSYIMASLSICIFVFEFTKKT
jgi:hypothetical protein